MAFKLTYTDGQETNYDDNTKWEVEAGVIKMGRESGKWTVLVSPSHWATLEVAPEQDKDKGEDKGKDEDKGKEDKDKEDKDKEDKDKEG